MHVVTSCVRGGTCGIIMLIVLRGPHSCQSRLEVRLSLSRFAPYINQTPDIFIFTSIPAPRARDTRQTALRPRGARARARARGTPGPDRGPPSRRARLVSLSSFRLISDCAHQSLRTLMLHRQPSQSLHHYVDLLWIPMYAYRKYQIRAILVVSYHIYCTCMCIYTGNLP